MKKLALAFFCAVLLHGSVAAQDLPPDILADQYLLEATKALENGDVWVAMRAFAKIEALDTERPSEFAYFYGKLLVEHGTTLDDIIKGQRLLKSYVILIAKDSEHYTPTLELLSEANRRLKEAAKKEAEARRLRTKEEAQRRRKAEEEAALLKTGCPDITGKFALTDSHGYRRLLIVRRDGLPKALVYKVRRDDLLMGDTTTKPSYQLSVGKKVALRFFDSFSDEHREIVFHTKCENGKLLVKAKHNYDTGGWIINYPYTVWKAYELVGHKLRVNWRTEYHPKDGEKSYEGTQVYHRVN